MDTTPVFGFSVRRAGDDLDEDGGKILGADRRLLEALLVSALSHVHDGAANELSPITDPPDTDIIDDGTGHLPPGATFWYVVTQLDVYGRESAPSPLVEVTLPDPIQTPGAPVLTYAPTGGTLLSGSYSYAVTAYTDDDPNSETLASTVATVTVARGATTNAITLDLPTLPAGASGFNIYRFKPGAFDYALLDSVTTDTNYVDDGSEVEDVNHRLPSVSTANTRYSVEITFPAELPDGHTWNVYRTDLDGVWANTFIHRVVEETTEGSGIITTEFVDDGSIPVSDGAPPPTGTATFPNPSKIDLVLHVEGILQPEHGGTGTTTGGGGGGGPAFINTDGLPGGQGYTGSTPPTDPPYDLQPGDIWIETELITGLSYAAEVLADSPLVLYMMDDAGAGPMVDTSGNSNDGTWSDDGPGSLNPGADGPGSDSSGPLVAMEWLDEFGFGSFAVDPSAHDTVTVGAWCRTPIAMVEADSPPAPSIGFAVRAFLDYITVQAEGTGWDYLYEGDPASLDPLLTSEGWVFVSAVIARNAAPDVRVNGAPYDVTTTGTLGGAGNFEAMTLRVGPGGGSGAMCGLYMIPGELSEARRDAHYAAVTPTP